MLRTLVNVNPTREFRAMEDLFESLFATPNRPTSQTLSLPIDITERDNTLYVKAHVPGVDPSELEITVEGNILTLRGETKSESFEQKEVKVYRREVITGAFARSIRLPEGLDLSKVDAEFKNGVVTIALPRVPEEKPASLKIQVRQAHPAIEAESVQNA